MRRLLALCLLLVSAAPAVAQHALGEGGPYDPSIPTPASVLGYEIGTRFTPDHMVVRYLSALASASPRMRLDTVATTWEGRPVLLATVSSEANMRRLDELNALAHRLADPRGASEAELRQAVASTPAIVWLGYTVHGDEASGVEAAMATLYQLTAGQDPDTKMILDSVLVLIDPVQNPDGHERHVQQVMWDLGRFGPDPYPRAVVHFHDWHGGRTNHYLFDLNRDWIVHDNPETQGRMAVFRKWYPHVAADLHEMGSSSTYFFAPPMAPVNANVSDLIRKGWQRFSRANAAAFAEHGWGFFTREGYDEFFPGYGPSWPLYSGAIGMTYEQGSSEGGAIRRDDGSLLTLMDAAKHHYTTSRATLLTAARYRAERVGDFLAFRQASIRGNANAPMRTLIFARDADGRADSMVTVLRRNDIEVKRTTAPVDLRRATRYGDQHAGRVRVDAGAYVVDLSQPEGTLAKTLLEPDPAFDPAFIEEELARREAGMGDRFYDMTGWALPFLYRVDAWWTPETVQPTGEVPPETAAPAPPGRAGYAYAFEPGSESGLRMLARLLADSVRVRFAPRSFTVPGGDFPRGAFVVVVNRNPGRDVHALVARAGEATRARVVPVNNALVESGTDLGSNSVQSIPIPRVALVAGDAVSSSSYGATWFTFDQLLDFPVTRIELPDLLEALDDFNVVVVPSAFDFGSALGDHGADALRTWVRNGGTLITLDAATAWLASADGFSRLTARPEPEPAEGETGAPLPTSVPGAILRTVADTLSPIMAGIEDREIPVLLFGSRVYQAPDDARPGEVVLRYADEDRLRLAGYLWPEIPARVAGTPYLFTEGLGSGRLIAFTGDPNFRAMWRGLLPLFANAVFLGGAM